MKQILDLLTIFISLHQGNFLLFKLLHIKSNKKKTKQKETDNSTNELQHDKTNKMACTPSQDSDQPGHLPNSIRSAQSDQNLCWPHEESLGPPLSAQQRL